jgi:hypothetical protein
MPLWTPETSEEFTNLCWSLDGYRPSAEQWAFHRSDASIRLIAGGIQAGKSKSTAREGDKYSVIEEGLGWIIGPDYVQARVEFDYLLDLYARMGVLDRGPGAWSRPASGPCHFTTTWGFKWETKSAGDPVKLASRAPDVCLFVEAAQCSEESFMKVVERATRKGAPVIASGTFETSQGWYAKRFQKYQGVNPEGGVSFSIPSWSNRIAFPGGRKDKKIVRAEAIMPPELFMERFGGVPHTPFGLVFREFRRDTHVRRLEYNPELPLEIAVDPAMHCYPILFIQWYGSQVWVIDELYLRNVIAQDAVQAFLDHPLSKFVDVGVMDIAGTQHHANYSQLEVWNEMIAKAGRRPLQFMQRKIWEKDWRDAISLRLHAKTDDGVPLLTFSDKLGDEVRSDGLSMGLIAEIETYKWALKNEKQALSVRPTKRNEDALSALGYWLHLKFGAVLQRDEFDDAVVPTYSLGW